MRRRKRIKSLVLALAVAGALASGAQAVPVLDSPGAGGASVAQRPDDRAGMLGIGVQPAPVDTSDVISRYLDRQTDYPVYQHSPGIGTMPAGAKTGSLVYRHSPGIGTVPDAAQALRPDDRPGILGVGETSPVTAASGGSFDWEDAGVGLGGGLAIALALGGAFLLTRRTLRSHRPAAVA